MLFYLQQKIQYQNDTITTSLKASIMDALFSEVFMVTTTGILLSNFLIELGGSSIVFGMLFSIPNAVSLVQLLGAYLSELTTSRFHYSLLTHGLSRLVWLFLVIGIVAHSLGQINSHQLINLTLVVILLSNSLDALGIPSWISWMARIVPEDIRGRFFGLRNGTLSLMNLICLPLLGLFISKFPGGTFQGFGIILVLGILSGVISLGCQYLQVDINPQMENASFTTASDITKTASNQAERIQFFLSKQVSSIMAGIQQHNSNFLIFVFYFSCWMLTFNLIDPFLTYYMLHNLKLDVSLVTLYGTIHRIGYLLASIFWGYLSDKIGNLFILRIVVITGAIIPLLWMNVSPTWFNIFIYLPMLNFLRGGVLAGATICNNNIQIAISPVKQQSIYVAIINAMGGISSAIGITIGGFIAEDSSWGGSFVLFKVSAFLILLVLIPLAFVKE